MGIYISAIYQGILWGIMGLGLFISFRILRFADLTTEASFTLGAATAAALITGGAHPLVATLSAVVTGALAGLITGILMTYFDIPGLLASIITMTAFYSINLRVMDKSNLSLRGFETVYDYFARIIDNQHGQKFFVGILFTFLVIAFISYLFKTDLGQAIIATGDNEVMSGSLGIRTAKMKRIALMLSNGIIALSGALVAQDNGFADVNMGAGTVVVAMSSIVMGEVLFPQQLTLTFRFISIVVGSIIYRLILVFVLRQGFNSNDFKLLSAAVLAIFLAIPTVTKKFKGDQSLKRKS